MKVFARIMLSKTCRLQDYANYFNELITLHLNSIVRIKFNMMYMVSETTDIVIRHLAKL